LHVLGVRWPQRHEYPEEEDADGGHQNQVALDDAFASTAHLLLNQ
jgi:hypothetical protein